MPKKELIRTKKNAQTIRILQKTVCRDLTLFSMQLWTRGYLHIKDLFRQGYTIALGKRSHGTFFIYRDREERQNTLEAFLEKFRDNPKEYYLIIQNAEQSVKKIKQIIRRPLTQKSLRMVKKQYIESWPAIIANYYIPDLVAAKMKKMSPQHQEILHYNNTMRTDTEGFYDAVEEALLCYARPFCPRLSGEEIILLSFDDLLQKKCPTSEELKNRKEAVVINGRVYSPKEGEKVILRKRYAFENDEVNTTVKLVCGTSAYKGKVQGIVRLIFNKREIHKVHSGDILVAPMTSPDFLPAMEKAAAFITDEGGMLCHAAIVAREMKKPCIIGTKIATKVFRDGDLVEVDATEGIVKRI